jgi:16S rRNA (cytosine967-C5)-methyltransferase
MKPASRINSTIEILDSTHRARVPLDKCVGDYMRVRRYIGAKDRSNIAERVYDMTRAHARIGWWLDQTKAEDNARNRVLAWVALGEGADEKRIGELFDGTQYAPDTLNETERDFVKQLIGKSLTHEDMPDSVRVECPPEHEEKLKALFGDQFQDEMLAMLNTAPLDLRINMFTADKEKVIGSLKKDGVEVTETPLSPWGLRCLKKSYISRTKAFTKGWIDIQDEGSQLIAWLCDAKPGMQVLDYCAGGGGKTLALGAAMQRKGRIVAADIDGRRLEKGRNRYKKASIADIVEIRAFSDERHRKWFKRQKETFDIVLVDAPCSGAGTWRRNPDMRWQNYGPDLEELGALQSEIMDKACKAVKKGGKFVYATCSLLPEENEEQVHAFLERNPEFEIMPIDEKTGIGSPFMRLTPLRHQTDGFFAAVLRKTD